MITRGFVYSVIAALAFLALSLGIGCSPDAGDPAAGGAGAGAEGTTTTERAGGTGPAPRLVLLISIDTLRPDHLGFYGYDRFTSPVLDTLALEGVVFEDVSSPAAWTLPSHASMLTGLFPREHGVVSFKTALPHSIPTLASILGRSGWDTAAVVNVEWLKRENYRLTQDFSKYAWAPAAVARRSPNTWVTDQVIDWVDQQTGEPLFIFAHYYDVHSDYKAEPSYERLFLSPYDGPVDGTGAQLKLQALPDAYIESCTLAFDEARCSFGDYLIVNGSTQKLELGQADVVRLEELYDAQIRQLDAELARLFTHLRKAGIFDDTLLIVTSDHGEEFMEHGSLEHFYAPYQESIRVPLLVRGPGLPAGLRVSTPVSLVDIAPTVLAQARVEAPPEMEGLDLSALWEGRDVSAFGSRFLYIEAPGGAAQNVTTGDYFPVYRGVRRGRHKLVVEQGSGTHALYDLSEDPAERQDISEREPELTAELLAVLQARHADTGEEPSPEDEVELSPEDLERLRALGYVP